MLLLNPYNKVGVLGHLITLPLRLRTFRAIVALVYKLVPYRSST
jgi:hypothetical protein